jgi:hypothetical protein
MQVLGQTAHNFFNLKILFVISKHEAFGYFREIGMLVVLKQ